MGIRKGKTLSFRGFHFDSHAMEGMAKFLLRVFHSMRKKILYDQKIKELESNKIVLLYDIGQ